MVQQVDRSFLRDWDVPDGGDLFKAEPYSDEAFFQNRPTLAWEGEGLDAYRRRYELKGAPRSAEAEAAAFRRVRELTRVLDAPRSAGGVSDADFPAAMNELAAERLASIVSSGPRCGVYTLIGVDTRQPVPPGMQLDDLIASTLRNRE